ncbi:MAG: methyltransferase domain-containing protein [Acidobacteria bacterium]|nr:methyltransferase domain-containing protein [Acidobacteriota bacterium]
MNHRDVFLTEPLRVVDVKASNRACARVSCYVQDEEYAASFGKQWTKFQKTQLDSYNGTCISRNFLEKLLNQPLDWLRGKNVIEFGAGAGRFTEYLAQFANLVVAVDLSSAIFVNAALENENVIAVQADLLHMPQSHMKFDLVFCRGVLQHLPHPPTAIAALFDWVKPGGWVVFDVYARGRLGRLEAKHLWRPVIQLFFTFDSYSQLLDRYAEKILRLRWSLKPFFPGISKRLLDYFLPIWDYRGVLPLSSSQLVEWAKLDTLDAMFSKYDNPMKHQEVARVLAELKCSYSSDERNNFFRAQASSAGAQLGTQVHKYGNACCEHDGGQIEARRRGDARSIGEEEPQ